VNDFRLVQVDVDTAPTTFGLFPVTDTPLRLPTTCALVQQHSQLRTLMVQGGHYSLGHFGEDIYLRRWRRKLAERGGRNAKKRAVVAVAWKENGGREGI
jgi:hypothetical protein